MHLVFPGALRLLLGLALQLLLSCALRLLLGLALRLRAFKHCLFPGIVQFGGKALLHVINVLLVRLPQLKDLLFMFRYA